MAFWAFATAGRRTLEPLVDVNRVDFTKHLSGHNFVALIDRYP